MSHTGSPTFRLLAGLAVTLSAVAVYSAYTLVQLRSLQEIQATTIDRNRTDSLLLLRVQNSLNSLALGMRDMLEGNESYPIEAWQAQFKRIRGDLEDAVRKLERNPEPSSAEQRNYLAPSLAQFWDALERVFELSRSGHEAEARTMIRLSLYARQEALTTTVARLLVRNNETEEQVAAQTHNIYARAERNTYLFLSAMLVLIVLTSLYLVHYNRRIFQQVATLSSRRSELAQQLISMQENTLRSVSRELHDDFGQVLTAVGVMLQQTGRRDLHDPAHLRADLREVQGIVQSTLEKIRALSHALHPVILDEIGFEGALDQYVAGFERQTGIAVDCQKEGPSRPLDRGIAIHLYRVMQEALNNVARHSRTSHAAVRLRFLPATVVLEVEDQGIGFRGSDKQGMGLVSIRERAELVNGRVEFVDRTEGGALVRMTVPTELEPIDA